MIPDEHVAKLPTESKEDPIEIRIEFPKMVIECRYQGATYNDTNYTFSASVHQSSIHPFEKKYRLSSKTLEQCEVLKIG